MGDDFDMSGMFGNMSVGVNENGEFVVPITARRPEAATPPPPLATPEENSRRLYEEYSWRAYSGQSPDESKLTTLLLPVSNPMADVAAGTTLLSLLAGGFEPDRIDLTRLEYTTTVGRDLWDIELRLVAPLALGLVNHPILFKVKADGSPLAFTKEVAADLARFDRSLAVSCQDNWRLSIWDWAVTRLGEAQRLVGESKAPASAEADSGRRVRRIDATPAAD